MSKLSELVSAKAVLDGVHSWHPGFNGIRSGLVDRIEDQSVRSALSAALNGAQNQLEAEGQSNSSAYIELRNLTLNKVIYTQIIAPENVIQRARSNLAAAVDQQVIDGDTPSFAGRLNVDEGVLRQSALKRIAEHQVTHDAMNANGVILLFSPRIENGDLRATMMRVAREVFNQLKDGSGSHIVQDVNIADTYQRRGVSETRITMDERVLDRIKELHQEAQQARLKTSTAAARG